MALSIVIVTIGAFLLGAFPTGYLVGWIAGVDVRRWGSGRTGATNVLRCAGVLPAILTIVGDFAKAGAAIWLAGQLMDTGWVKVLAGSAAILGHIYTPFLGWKGGRGVATALAILTIVCPLCAVVVLLVGLVVVLVSRYVSLASLTVASLMPITLLVYRLLFGGDYWWLVYGVVAAAMIWLSHRDNLVRLIRGTERRLGQRAQPLG